MNAWRWLVPLLVAGVIWMLPHAGFGPRHWSLLCLFAVTVCSLITRPLPAGAMVLIALTAGVFLGVFTLQEALSGFGNVTVWLIVAAFLFAKGFVQTRLGERIAYQIIRHIGGRPDQARLLHRPRGPCDGAHDAVQHRAGGRDSLSHHAQCRSGVRIGDWSWRRPDRCVPDENAVSGRPCRLRDVPDRDGPNPLVAELARGAGTEVPWITWALAACVPGVVSLAVVPYAVYRLCPPGLRDTTAAQSLAAERLAGMGSITRNERVMLMVFVVVLLLWLSGELHGVSPTAVAYLGVALLLITRVLAWQDILEEKTAWDALIWFGGLVMLAGQLDKAGFPAALARGAAGYVSGWSWWSALVVLIVVYVYSHYAFASLVAHVTAMFPAFFAVAIGLGAPPLLAALTLGFFSSLNAATTHYGTGPAPIVFGAGYLSHAEWWRIGFVISLLHLMVWLPIGFLWWKVIGLW